MINNQLLFFIGLALSGLPALAEPVTEPAPLMQETRYVMGTKLEIKLCSPNRETLNKAFTIAENLDRLLSNYKADSEISRLNQKQELENANSETLQLLRVSKQLHRVTLGAFDITIGPIFQLWSQAENTQQLPKHQTIFQMLPLVNSENILFSTEGPSIKFKFPGMFADTGGIGKGFAVDRIAELLQLSNVGCGLVNFGHSSIYALGAPPGSTAWKLLIQFPKQQPLGTIELKDQFFSASSTIAQSWKIAGKNFGKIINPKTGYPVTDDSEVLVTARDATTAEALTKALIIFGGGEKIDPKATGDFQYLLFSRHRRVSQSGKMLVNLF